MDSWTAKRFLFSPPVRSVRFTIELAYSQSAQRGYLQEGLRTGFYPGGGGQMQQVYQLIIETAGSHGLWVKRSNRWPWRVYIVGDVPLALRRELWERYQADCVACRLAESCSGPATGEYWLNCKEGDWYYYANTRTLQDKHWLRDLSKKYVDDAYHKKVEPYIKRVENGKLVIRRTNGKWSIG